MPAYPTWIVDHSSGAPTLRPAPGADFSNVRLGMAITQLANGLSNTYSIVARRNGAKVWKLDYESEADCEGEWISLRAYCVGFAPLFETRAYCVTQFDESTGAIASQVAFGPKIEVHDTVAGYSPDDWKIGKINFHESIREHVLRSAQEGA